MNSTNHLHRRLEYGSNDMESDFNSSTFLEESSSLGATGDTSDSKDSQHIKEDIGKSELRVPQYHGEVVQSFVGALLLWFVFV